MNAEIDGPKRSHSTHGHVLSQPSPPPPPHPLQRRDGGIVAQHFTQHAYALGAKVVVVEAGGDGEMGWVEI